MFVRILILYYLLVDVLAYKHGYFASVKYKMEKEMMKLKATMETKTNFFDRQRSKRLSSNVVGEKKTAASTKFPDDLLEEGVDHIEEFKSSRGKMLKVTGKQDSYFHLDETIDEETRATLLDEQPSNPDFRSGYITIMGNPNVGKSTLMNTLMNQNLSIVNPKPQTTRHEILGIVTTDDYQMVLTDTPGLLLPKYKLQSSMQHTIHNTVANGGTEGVIIMSDVYCEPLADESIYRILQNISAPIVIVINKLDLLNRTSSSMKSHHMPMKLKKPSNNNKHNDKMRLEEHNNNNNNNNNNHTIKSWDEIVHYWQTLVPQAEIIGIAAKTKYNIAVLVEHLVALLPKGPMYYPADMISDRNERFFTTEIIRECILSLYKSEIPYSCEVLIDSFKDKNPEFSEIYARIMVNRPSQTAIMVGTGGNMLRRLGTMARQKIEEMLDRKAYLSLKVDVDPDWRDNIESLQKYGYISKEKKE